LSKVQQDYFKAMMVVMQRTEVIDSNYS